MSLSSNVKYSVHCYTAVGIPYIAFVINHISNYPEGSVSSLFKYKQKEKPGRITWKFIVYLAYRNGSKCILENLESLL